MAQFRRVQTSVVALPLIVRGNADPCLATPVLDRHSGIGVFECGFDLTFGETGRLQTSFRLGKNCQNVLFINCLLFRDAYDRRALDGYPGATLVSVAVSPVPCGTSCARERS